MTLKRVLDLVVSVIGLAVLFPLMMLLIVLVRVKLGGPVLFTQMRPGLDGREFRMIKFRTMTDCRESNGDFLSDEKRLTSFGKWLRATSLDELPGLISVIRGDMSLVGPRPLLLEYMSLYTPEQSRRHLVRPGITGWAQINGRNAISWEEKFSLDVWYVDNQSTCLDGKILFLTVKKVLFRSDISAEGEATMSKFTGSSSSGGDKRA